MQHQVTQPHILTVSKMKKLYHREDQAWPIKGYTGTWHATINQAMGLYWSDIRKFCRGLQCFPSIYVCISVWPIIFCKWRGHITMEPEYVYRKHMHSWGPASPVTWKAWGRKWRGFWGCERNQKWIQRVQFRLCLMGFTIWWSTEPNRLRKVIEQRSAKRQESLLDG